MFYAKNGAYERGVHYVTFKEGLYANYMGFTKWLFSARGGRIADHIHEHFVTVVFVAHLGDDEQRAALAKDVLRGCSIHTVADLLKLVNVGDPLAAFYIWNAGGLRDAIDKLPGAEVYRDLITPRGEYPKVFKFGWTGSMATRGLDYKNEIDGQLPAPISQDFRLVRFDVMRDAKCARDAETDFKNVFLAGKDWNMTVYGKTCTSSGATKEFKEFILIKSKKDEEALHTYITQLRMVYGHAEKTAVQKVVDQLISEKEKLEIKIEHVQELASKDLEAAKKMAQKEVEGAHREMRRLSEQIAMLQRMCDKLIAATRS